MYSPPHWSEKLLSGQQTLYCTRTVVMSAVSTPPTVQSSISLSLIHGSDAILAALFLRRCNKLFHGVEKCSTEQVPELREAVVGTTELDVVDGLSSDREFRDLHEIRKSC